MNGQIWQDFYVHLEVYGYQLKIDQGEFNWRFFKLRQISGMLKWSTNNTYTTYISWLERGVDRFFLGDYLVALYNR